MRTENGVQVHYALLLRHKKDEIMPFPVTRKKLEIITLSEVRKKKRSTAYTFLWNLNMDTNKLLYKRETAS